MNKFNTTAATEFSLCFSPDMKYAVFTRYSDADRRKRGLYLSTNTGSRTNPEWSQPQKVLTNMYGWGGQFSSDGELFYFTFGEDVWQVPVGELGVKN